MAANTYRPGRALAILAVLIAVMAAVVYWPFSDESTTPKLGLDLRGGTSVTLLATPIGEGEVTDEAVQQAVEIIRQRVDGQGVAEAEVTTQTSDEGPIIVVAVPGVNQSRIVELVGQTAQLNFRPVIAEAAGVPSEVEEGQELPESEELPIQSAENDAALQAQFAALDCTDEAARTSTTPDDPEQFLVTCTRDGGAKYLLDKAAVLGTNITDATAGLPTQGSVGGWQVNLNFDGEGTRKFAETTSSLVGQQPPQNQFAIVLDGLVVSAPSVNEAIPGGQAQITGQFTQDDARDLAGVLKYGALPLAFEIQEVESVSPTLGSDQLEAGIIAAALGLILVVVFLMLYYRALGLVAVFSLIFVGVLTYLSFVILGRTVGFTLTLAGVTGAIVAIGVTADSFIIYFERIRDELRDGKSMRAAADQGWAKARRTILAADFMSLLAAVVLYFVSVGNVRGFAFVLGLTTLLDVLVVFLFTRPLVTILAQRPFFAKGHRLSGVDPKRLGSETPVRPSTSAAPVSAAAASKES